MSLLIKNALIINENSRFEGDVLIEGKRIEEIGSNITKLADTVIDAAGKVLMPGMIDDQVHFRDPGVTHKADIHSESMASAAGGTTSFMDMPNVIPSTVTHEQYEAKLELASTKAVINYGFHFGATNDNLEEIKKIDPERTAGVKIFMGASTGNMLVDREAALAGIFEHSPVIILTHCEDTPMIKENEAAAREKYGDAIPMSEHPNIRSREACYKSSSFAVNLAKKHDARLHILHLTTAEEMDLFSDAALKDKRITAEACVHHLFFNADDYERLGTHIKCNPAIKLESDRKAIIQAILDGRVDVIATDHAPHLLEEKASDSYFEAPAGLPLTQWALQSLIDKPEFSLEFVAEKTAHAVAELFQIVERGFIREGYFADLVLVDMEKPDTVKREDVISKCGWSPFEGHTFNCSIDTTIVNGEIVYQNGQVDSSIRGDMLTFEKTRR